MNIYQRLNKCREAVPYIQKNANVTSYKVVTHDQVNAKTRQALLDNGVFTTITLKSDNTQLVPGNNGKTQVFYESIWQVKFINVENPTEVVEIDIPSQALSYDEKGPGKACSYALKTALLKIFAVETGENDESIQEFDKKAAEAKQVNKNERLGQIRYKMKKTDTNEVDLCKYVTQNDALDKLEKLNETQLTACEAALMKKEKWQKGQPVQ